LNAWDFEPMAYPQKDEMVWVGGRWWRFPGVQIGTESEFEWRDNRVYLLEPDGSAVEGILFVGEVAPIDAFRQEAQHARARKIPPAQY
jgi:hypothetical protein